MISRGSRRLLQTFFLFIAFTFVVFLLLLYPTQPSGRKIKTDYVKTRRVNAVLLVLTRNSDLPSLLDTLTEFERTFNARFNYPYVFLNDKPFTEHFQTEVIKHLSKWSSLGRTKNASFGQIPKEHWSYPNWLDPKEIVKAREEMHRINLPYGGLESYHHMCRYYSGFFYKHPLVLQYDYYWRIEPGARFLCELYEDPFLVMLENNFEYGFIQVFPEYTSTVPTLWNTTKQFIKDVYPKLGDTVPIQNRRIMNWLLDEGGTEWNNCHFWSNFEIGHFGFFRSPQYQTYFDYLDKAGGFFLERWGDAPVHALAIGLFLQPSQIYHFHDIGYQHGLFAWCPKSLFFRISPWRCKCDTNYEHNMANDPNESCITRFRMKLTAERSQVLLT